VDAVTEVLLDRRREVDRLTRMMIVSLAAHAAVITAVALAPVLRSTPRENANVMTISIAGPSGPIQGRNPMAGREIQEAVPQPAKPRVATPPAPPKPEMVEPVKTAKPAPKAVAKPEPKKEEPARSRTPSQGAEVKPGDARADTQGAPIKFGGLATGGGGMNSAYTDYADFCCPEYLATMTRLIYANWQAKQGVEGSNVARFVITRDGTIADVTIEQGSNQFLNLASQRALAMTKQLPPLPAAFTGNQLIVHLAFQYRR
jgi:outer membrane biosynthesis protein TonB